VLVGLDVELFFLGAEEGEDVERGEVAGRVVEEHVLGAVVDGDAVGDEGAGHRLGEVEDLALADGLERRHAVEVALLVHAGGAAVGGDREGDGLGELLELLAREEADQFSKRAEAARIDTQAVASRFCVAGGRGGRGLVARPHRGGLSIGQDSAD
jgi:hypothetical protein